VRVRVFPSDVVINRFGVKTFCLVLVVTVLCLLFGNNISVVTEWWCLVVATALW